MKNMSNVNILSAIQNCGGLMNAADKLDMKEATLRNWFKDAKKNKQNPTKFVITCAQNATVVNEDFLNALHTYCLHNEAQLMVIPYTYGAVSEMTDWYASIIEPFFMTDHIDLNSNLKVLGNYKSRPTAINPLGGSTTKTITQSSSGIFPHPQVSLLSVPTPHSKLPKVLTTTGCVTDPNYTKTKTGLNGEFNHTFGAVVVTIKDDSIFHMRHVLAGDDGSFYDLDKLYLPNGKVKKNQEILAIATGDEHVDWIDPSVVEATYTAEDSIVKTLKPAKIFRHDLLDFYSQNHHHKFNFLTNYVKHHTVRDGKPIANIEAEMKRCIEFINETTPEWAQTYIVQSNHNDALTRWLNECDYRKDYENAKLFHWLSYAQLDHAEMTESGVSSINLFEYWSRDKTDAIFLERDKSFRVADIEMSFHGDQGSNGARGSARGFSQIGTKSIIGHSHTPMIVKGAYQVGTSSRLKLEYTKGPSSWLHTHCIIYPNGKRTLINIINGEWK